MELGNRSVPSDKLELEIVAMRGVGQELGITVGCIATF